MSEGMNHYGASAEHRNPTTNFSLKCHQVVLLHTAQTTSDQLLTAVALSQANSLT
jgi:hypothetical protein